MVDSSIGERANANLNHNKKAIIGEIKTLLGGSTKSRKEAEKALGKLLALRNDMKRSQGITKEDDTKVEKKTKPMKLEGSTPKEKAADAVKKFNKINEKLGIKERLTIRNDDVSAKITTNKFLFKKIAKEGR